MFTGIIKEVGQVIRLEKKTGLYRLAVASKTLPTRAGIGDSVAVDGVCLTLVGKEERGILRFDVMEETVRRTTLSSPKEGGRVNLEDSLRAGDAMGGHFVLGHVDCVGKIMNLESPSGGRLMEIGMPDEFAPLAVEKGSVAVDGISLTVGEAKADLFNVYLIPHTLKSTTLGSKQKGDRVNIEFDIIGKYIKRLEAAKRPLRITESFLKEKGF